MRTRVALEEGVFYPVEDGYVLCFAKVEPGELYKGNEYTLNSMFRMWDLMRDDVCIGFFFYSSFKIESKGGYMVTFMESKRGKATTSKLIIRHDKVMLYDIPGCGAMALSTRISPEVLSIFMEQ